MLGKCICTQSSSQRGAFMSARDEPPGSPCQQQRWQQQQQGYQTWQRQQWRGSRRGGSSTSSGGGSSGGSGSADRSSGGSSSSSGVAAAAGVVATAVRSSGSRQQPSKGTIETGGPAADQQVKRGRLTIRSILSVKLGADAPRTLWPSQYSKGFCICTRRETLLFRCSTYRQGTCTHLSQSLYPATFATAAPAQPCCVPSENLANCQQSSLGLD